MTKKTGKTRKNVRSRYFPLGDEHFIAESPRSWLTMRGSQPNTDLDLGPIDWCDLGRRDPDP